MLELEVVPERSLGCDKYEFILGMHFSQTVAVVQSLVGTIKGVQVLYSSDNPLGVDIIINLPLDGIRLMFDPVVQRLKIIEVVNMKLVKLKYCGFCFNSPTIAPSLEQIEHSFGATIPGVFDPTKQVFSLHFRGLSFFFPVEGKMQPDYAHGLGSLHFEPGKSPVVSRMAIFNGASLSDSKPPMLPLQCYLSQIYLESAIILRGCQGTKGLRLNLYTESSVRTLDPKKQCFTKELYFGDTCQDIKSSLGSPNCIFYKSEDKMKIHSPNTHRGGATVQRSDYFFNYFTLGIDVLFDAVSQRAKKFILHTNYPGHYNFNMYHRCEFHLQLSPDIVTDEKHPPETLVKVNAYSRWDAVKTRLTPSERPVVLHRAGSTNTANPFGSTFCYGYQDIIFEVMPNNHIASVTLFNDNVPLCLFEHHNTNKNAHVRGTSSTNLTNYGSGCESTIL